MVPVLRREISNTQSRPLNGHPPSIILIAGELTSMMRPTECGAYIKASFKAKIISNDTKNWGI